MNKDLSMEVYGLMTLRVLMQSQARILRQYMRTLTLILCLCFFSFGLSVPEANACAVQRTDTTATGMIPDGCFNANFKYESIQLNVSEIKKTGNLDSSNSFNLKIVISVNEPQKIDSLIIAPFHYDDEVNVFRGEDACIGTSGMKQNSGTDMYNNFISDGQRKSYTFDLVGKIGLACGVGDIYFAVIPSFGNVTGPTLRGKTLPGNRLTIKPADRIVGERCEQNEQGRMFDNPDGSIWFCVSESLGTGDFRWKLITGSTPTQVLNCMMTCSKVTVLPKQVTNSVSASQFSSKSPSKALCPKVGKLMTVGSDKFKCVLNGKKLEWVNISKPAKTKSEASRMVATGCKSFPSAIVRLQNASGSSYNPAFIAAQEAAFDISQAGRLDSKFQILSNSQRIIIEYAQAVGWGGKGYFGDINVVKTALATFNSNCNSNLSLRSR